MTLPEVAKRLRDLASQHGIAELAVLADQIKRRSGTRAPRTSRPMTPELAAEIRSFCERNPDLSQQKVASVFNVNSGRVSEVLRGVRE